MVSLESYDRKCKDTLGGIDKIYLFPFVKYTRSQVVVDGMNLTDFPETVIYEYDVIGSYSQNSEFEGGDLLFIHSFNFTLSKVYDIIDVQKLLIQDYRIIVLTNNGDYLIGGTRNGLRGSTSNTSGTTKNEDNGFKLDFTGKEENPLLLVDNLEDFLVYDQALLLTELPSLFELEDESNVIL